MYLAGLISRPGQKHRLDESCIEEGFATQQSQREGEGKAAVGEKLMQELEPGATKNKIAKQDLEVGAVDASPKLVEQPSCTGPDSGYKSVVCKSKAAEGLF